MDSSNLENGTAPPKKTPASDTYRYAANSNRLKLEYTVTGGSTLTTCFLTDHLGSVVAVLDASGTLLSQPRYYPFGGVRADANMFT